MSIPLLQVRDLSLAFTRRDPQGQTSFIDALSAVQFDLHAGETLALLGESGCGKSLTSLALMRLLPPNARYQSGRVLLASDGSPSEDLLRVSETRMRQVRGRHMAMIFQEPATSLNPVMRIGEQIAESVRLHRQLCGSALFSEVSGLLEQVGLPDPGRVARAYPFELSGGMKQRAMIAMALAGDPQVLLADEPTTALDVTLQAQILDLLRDLQQQRQMGMLLITHDLAVVASRADRVAVMYAGQIVESGPVRDVLNHPAHPYTRALLSALPERASHGQPLLQLPGRVPSLGSWPLTCRFVPRCADLEPHCLVESPPLVAMPRENLSAAVTHDVLCWRAGEDVSNPADVTVDVSLRPAIAASDPVLAVKNLSISYQPNQRTWLGQIAQIFGKCAKPALAVDDIDLMLYPGETLALVGESGCGKSTTARAVLGLQPICEGQISLQGLPIAGEGIKPPKGWRRQIQMVFQDPFASLDPRHRIRNILNEGPRALGLAPESYSETVLCSLLERVGLGIDALDRYPHEFSGGQRQRIAIARALAVNPAVLICDEPTSALDVSVQAQILNLLRDLQAETGMAYLFITHNFGVVRYLADRVAVMQTGRIVETGSVNDILDRPQHDYTKALLAAVPVIC